MLCSLQSFVCALSCRCGLGTLSCWRGTVRAGRCLAHGEGSPRLGGDGQWEESWGGWACWARQEMGCALPYKGCMALSMCLIAPCFTSELSPQLRCCTRKLPAVHWGAGQPRGYLQRPQSSLPHTAPH